MFEFFLKIPLMIQVACAALSVAALAFAIWLFREARTVSRDMEQFAAAIRRATAGSDITRHSGLSLEAL